jgi:hypothetical protein
MLASHIKSRPKRQVPTEAKGLVKAWLRVGLWRIEIRASVGLMVKCKTVGLTPNRRLLSVAGADDGEKHPLRWLAVNLEVSFQGSISPGTSQLIRSSYEPSIVSCCFLEGKERGMLNCWAEEGRNGVAPALLRPPLTRHRHVPAK